MVSFNNLLSALDDRTIAQRVGNRHDEERLQYNLRSNTVRNFNEFSEIIADYFNYHYTRCVSSGGGLSRAEASSRAKELIENEYHRQHTGDIVSAYNDAHNGTNGGLRKVLDIIAEALKTESVNRYVREVFDRQVTPNSWEDKVAIIRQFIAQYGAFLDSSIRREQPERYAQNYQELIHVFVGSLRQTSSVFRRL